MSMTELVISKAKAEDSKDVALMAKWQSNLESLSAFDNDWDGEGAKTVWFCMLGMESEVGYSECGNFCQWDCVLS